MTRSIQQLRTVGAGGSYSERGVPFEARWLGGFAPQPGYLIDEAHHGTTRTVQPGRAALFDGVDDRVLVPHHSDFDIANGASLTVSTWLRSADAATFRAFVSKRNPTPSGWEFAINTTGVARFVARGSSTIDCVGLTQIDDDVWHHVVATITPTAVRIYVDGVLDRVQAGTHTSVPASDEGLYISGRRNNATPGAVTEFFPGRLFDVRLYNRALTASEVAAIYNSSRPGGRPQLYLYPANLVGHWKLDDGDKISNNGVAATAVLDSSGNDRHGHTAASAVTFDYVGDDVPFSWQNEVGFTRLDPDSASPSWTALWDNNFSVWTASGADAKAVALSNQTWRGETGLFAARFLNGAAAGSANNAVTGGAPATFNAPGNSVHICTAEIALSRPLAAGENIWVYWGGGLLGPIISLQQNAGKPDPTDWHSYTSTSVVYPSTQTQHFRVIPSTGVTGGDITVYFRNVRYWDTGIPSTDGGHLDGAEWPDVVPANSKQAGHDIFGNPLQYEGRVPRNALLKESFCGNFDGADDLLTIPASGSYPSGNSPRTITGWLYWNVTTSVGDIFFTTGGGAGVGGIIRLMNDAADQGISLAFTGIRRHIVGFYPFQRWFHFAIRVPVGATLCEHVEMLVDGELMALATSAGGSTTLQTLANQPITTGVSAPMRFADFRLYNTALSNDDIRLLARGLEPSTLPVGHWPLAEGDGTTVFDITANVNHGTLSNITLGTFWSATEQVVHRNLRYGYRPGAGTARIPARHGGLVAANGNAITRPAIIGHNGAETKIDFTGGQPEAPWCDPARLGLTLPQSYAFGDALPAGMTKRVNASQNNAESLYTVT